MHLADKRQCHDGQTRYGQILDSTIFVDIVLVPKNSIYFVF